MAPSAPPPTYDRTDVDCLLSRTATATAPPSSTRNAHEAMRTGAIIARLGDDQGKEHEEEDDDDDNDRAHDNLT
uniref:Uncharacterized protein n=1 Tax=Oryza sativa subsp. japonica TaxID=39947 RepID=Q6EQZ2_ORYSJ|nr:hypothetical protein [Oryza sativa Japonica Group]